MQEDSMYGDLDDKCEVPRCRNPVSMIYYDHGICYRCWCRHDLSGEFNLKKVFGIVDAPLMRRRVGIVRNKVGVTRRRVEGTPVRITIERNRTGEL